MMSGHVGPGASGGVMVRIIQVAPGRRGAYATIGDALSDAPQDAVIEVAEGVYREALYVVNKRVVLRPAPGAGQVVIEADGVPHPAVSCRNGGLHLEGLALKAGDADAVVTEQTDLRMERCTVTARNGAGISGTGGSVDLRKCTIDGAVYGLLIEDADGTVNDCVISNAAEDGIIVRIGAAPAIRATSVTGCGNRGIYVYQFAKPVIEACEVANTGGAGVAVAHRCEPVLRRCKIHDTQGVGISFDRGCGGLVEECRLDNTASPPIEIAEDAYPVVRERAEGVAAAGYPG